MIIGKLANPHLGIVPNPQEINRTVRGCCNMGVASEAEYWSTARSGGARGLGVVPNDFEIARQRSCYLPVQHGWIVGERNGRKVTYPGGNMGTPGPGPYSHGLGAIVHGQGMGEAAAAAMLTPEERHRALLEQLVHAEKKKAAMAAVSAVAVVALALVTIGMYVKGGG